MSNESHFDELRSNKHMVAYAKNMYTTIRCDLFPPDTQFKDELKL
jgi:hypothetical protein